MSTYSILKFIPFILASTSALASSENSLSKLTDKDLSNISGQALMALSYIAPNDQENKMIGQNIGFYKLGMESLIEINANIRKLQLGCGGINGPGGCDLDIDNLSLSGLQNDSNGRVQSSAEISNPFIEFAIKNPNSSATREIKGIRFSAETVKGLLTIGEENSLTPNGINSFSGYMNIKETTGIAYTEARNMTYQDTGMTIHGNINASIRMPWPFSDINIARLPFFSDDYNLNLTAARADISLGNQIIQGTRMKSATLNGVANINRIDFGGQLNASVPVIGPFNLDLKKIVTGNITGLTANLSIDQNLGLIHRLPLNNPFSLSLQQQPVFWPGAEVVANRGWWLAFEDPIDIGNVTPSQTVKITNDVLKQIVGPISSYLENNPPACRVLNCFFGSDIVIGNVNLPNTSVQFPLKDLHLANQGFAPNCYGGLKFC